MRPSPVRAGNRRCRLRRRHPPGGTPLREKTQAAVGSHQVDDLPQQQAEGDDSQRPGQVDPGVGLGPSVGGDGLNVQVGELARRVVARATSTVVVGQPHVGGHALELVGVDLRHPGLPTLAVGDVVGLGVLTGGG